MAPVQISEVKGSGRENRTAAHSHIKGLGLRSDGTAEKTSGGFIGQAAAREVNEAPTTYMNIGLPEERRRALLQEGRCY